MIYTIAYPAWPAGHGATPGLLQLFHPRRRGAGDRPAVEAANAAINAAARHGRSDRDRGRSGAVSNMPQQRRGGVPDLVRAVPRLRRGGAQGLSQPAGRRLALGRHDGRISTTRSPTASATRQTRQRGTRRCRPSARSCRTRRSTRSSTTCMSCRRPQDRRGRPPPASRSFWTTAPPATARTARATAIGRAEPDGRDLALWRRRRDAARDRDLQPLRRDAALLAKRRPPDRGAGPRGGDLCAQLGGGLTPDADQ